MTTTSPPPISSPIPTPPPRAAESVLTKRDIRRSMGPKCIAWRQTIDCDPNGKREPASDLTCAETILPGKSGYCECLGGARVARVDCDHEAFRCNDECSHLWNMQMRESQIDRVGNGYEMPGLLDRLSACGPHGWYDGHSTGSAVKIVNHSEFVRMHHFDDGARRGCRVSGSIEVMRVPGRIVFESRAPADLLANTQVDMSHHIHRLSISTTAHEFTEPSGEPKRNGSLDGYYFEGRQKNQHVVHDGTLS